MIQNEAYTEVKQGQSGKTIRVSQQPILPRMSESFKDTLINDGTEEREPLLITTNVPVKISRDFFVFSDWSSKWERELETMKAFMAEEARKMNVDRTEWVTSENMVPMMLVPGEQMIEDAGPLLVSRLQKAGEEVNAPLMVYLSNRRLIFLNCFEHTLKDSVPKKQAFCCVPLNFVNLGFVNTLSDYVAPVPLADIRGFEFKARWKTSLLREMKQGVIFPLLVCFVILTIASLIVGLVLGFQGQFGGAIGFSVSLFVVGILFCFCSCLVQNFIFSKLTKTQEIDRQITLGYFDPVLGNHQRMTIYFDPTVKMTAIMKWLYQFQKLAPRLAPATA